MTKVKYKKNPLMQYGLLDEDDTHYKIEYIGWVPKAWMEIIEGESDLPEVTDVMVYITNNRDKL